MLNELSPDFAPPATSPQAFAAELVARSGSSFTLGMRALSKPRRETMYAIYAFCRIVDDIADSTLGTPSQKHALLDQWRTEVEALYTGHPRSLVGRALLGPVNQFALPREEFDLMIDGMAMDVAGPIVAPDLQTLLDYTRRVAGTVGMLSVRVFGADEQAEREQFAIDLADAMQLTNILRDVEEDAEIGRLYLPAETLEKHQMADLSPADVTRHPSLPLVCRDVGVIARNRYERARAALQTLDRSTLRSALMMMGVYEGYLDRMEALNWRRDENAVSMSKWKKLGLGLRYAFAFPERAIDPALMAGSQETRS